MLIADQDLKHKIRELRLQGNQTMEEFGRRFRVTRQAVARWENGTAIPPANVLRELAIERVYLLSKPPKIPRSLARKRA